MNDVDINIAREEGRNNRTVIFTFFSKKDKAVVSCEGFPYETKYDTLHYFDYGHLGTVPPSGTSFHYSQTMVSAISPAAETIV